MSSENNKRIAKNTLMLYFRMILIMGVNLYTSRIILNVLGVTDFGIYNVVGGIVTMFAFLNGAMSAATQRFLSVEVGRNDDLQLKKVFSISLSIHLLIALVIILLAETIGLWFLNSKMNIPIDRMGAAQWVYQFSILACAISVVQIPYNSSIIAHEKMGVYAYVSIIEVILKLIIVFMLVWIGYDRLKLYAILTFVVSTIVILIYQNYCKRKFVECHYKIYKDKSLFKSLLNYSGWNLFANLAWMTMGQGINILLNIFFGPTINAARGIAFQLNNVISTFINNIRTAVNPQIVKSYAAGDIDNMMDLVFESAKYSHYLLLLISLPLILETHIILNIWLKIVPNYTIFFCQLILINTLILNFDMSISAIFQAIGRIKENQIMSSVTYLLVLPISYFLLKNRYGPEVTFFVQIVATIIVAFIVKLILLVEIINMKVVEYFRRLILPSIKVTLVTLILPVLIRLTMPEGILRLILVTFISILSVILSTYYLGMNKSTQLRVNSIIASRLNKHIKS
jgi:O-antigen/teichoic acid export membrane protein